VQVCQGRHAARQAIQQRIHRIDHLEPRQMLTNTDVRTVAEGGVVTSRSTDVEASGSGNTFSSLLADASITIIGPRD